MLGIVAPPCVAVAMSEKPRWTHADEVGCSLCRKCGGLFIWGEVTLIQDSKHPKGRKPIGKREKWVMLDPDLMLHGCKKR